MSHRIPVNPGRVEWSGDNPGIYLRDHVDGPWTGLGTFFNVVYSPHGRGRTMIVLAAPARKSGFPDVGNVCVTDNRELSEYLVRDFVRKFPSFRDQPGLDAMTWFTMDSIHHGGDMQSSWRETVTADNLELVMEWQDLGEPFAVEVAPQACATGEHDMYSVFLEARAASIAINGEPLSGKVTERMFFGRRMSTAFLAVSETWVTPPTGRG